MILTAGQLASSESITVSLRQTVGGNQYRVMCQLQPPGNIAGGRWQQRQTWGQRLKIPQGCNVSDVHHKPRRVQLLQVSPALFQPSA